MASTSATEPSSAMEEYPNWLKMPDELMANILQRLRTGEIIYSARKVCRTWRIICDDPEMWKVIDMRMSLDSRKGYYDIERLTKQAVDLSCGELIDIGITDFGSDHLLNYIVLRSSKLKRLCLSGTSRITGSGWNQAVKMVPQLEKLHFSYIPINVKDIEVIGRNCPQLKSFKMNKWFSWRYDDNALAIANNMPELRHLVLIDDEMTNDGLRAIFNGCLHLESLDVETCYNLDLDGNLGKLCRERIKDLKFPFQMQDYYLYNDAMFSFWDSNCNW